MTRRPGELFAVGELEALFSDQAPVTVVPWRRVVRLLRSAEDRARLGALLVEPPRADQFVDLDPRELAASQPAITRAGVGYYLHPEDAYRRSGRTWADQFDVANKHPVVHRHGSELVVLSGHHRAAAALLVGQPLRARLIQADWIAGSGAAAVVTPSLLAGGTTPYLEHWACADRQVAEVAVNSRATAWMMKDHAHDIRHLLRELAIDEAWLRHQLHYARTGRIRIPRPDNGVAHH